MLTVDSLQVAYGRRGPLVLNDVTLEVPTGACVGLIGESGSGKSTVARTVMGVVPIRSGSITVDGVQVARKPASVTRTALRVCQLVFQDPHSSLSPRMTVGAAVAQGVSAAPGQRENSVAVQKRVSALFELVGLSEQCLYRFPHELSGGQCQRVAIARAIAVKPRMLLLDEVTASLDVSVQAVILNLLSDLRSELSLSYLYISHDLSIVRYFCDEVYVMRDGRIVESGDSALLQNPQDSYTRDLIEAAPRLGAHRWNHKEASTT